MFAIHFPGPFGGCFNKDRNGQPDMTVGAIERATLYETLEDAQLALERVKKAKCYKTNLMWQQRANSAVIAEA